MTSLDKEKRKKNGAKAIFDETVAGDFPQLIKNIK